MGVGNSSFPLNFLGSSIFAGIFFATNRNDALLAVLFFGLFFIFTYKLGITIARKRKSWRIF